MATTFGRESLIDAVGVVGAAFVEAERRQQPRIAFAAGVGGDQRGAGRVVEAGKEQGLALDPADFGFRGLAQDQRRRLARPSPFLELQPSDL